MNVPVRPPSDPHAGRPPDDLDRLMHAFFRAEMPQPWPAAPTLPARDRATILPSVLADARTEAHSSAARSRTALAASVLVLVGACWAASGRLHDAPAGRGNFGGNEAADLSHSTIVRHLPDETPAVPTKETGETSKPLPGGDPVSFP